MLRRQRRGLRKLLGSLGRPNGFDHDGLIFSAIAVGFDTMYQRQIRFGAQSTSCRRLSNFSRRSIADSTSIEIKRMDVDADV